MHPTSEFRDYGHIYIQPPGYKAHFLSAVYQNHIYILSVSEIIDQRPTDQKGWMALSVLIVISLTKIAKINIKLW